MLLIERIFAFWIIVNHQLCLTIGNRLTLAHIKPSGAWNLRSTDSLTKQEEGASKGQTENVAVGGGNSHEKFIKAPPSVGRDDSSSSTGSTSSLNGTTHHHPVLPLPISVKVELSSLDAKNKDRDTPPLSHLILGLALQVRGVRINW